MLIQILSIKFSSIKSICDLYNIQVTQSEALIPMEFQIVKRDEFENTWKENTLEVVAKFTAEEGTREVSYLLKENDVNFEYGIRACEVEGECYNVKDIDLTGALKPAYCNDNDRQSGATISLWCGFAQAN